MATRALLIGLMCAAGCINCVDILGCNRTERTIVVITFDDGHHSIYDFCFPLMRQYGRGWAATHFLPVSHVGQPGHVTLEQLQAMEEAGWETGGHGLTHENLSSAPLSEVQLQVTRSDRFLRENGLSHASYAYAFGNYNQAVADTVRARFDNIRTSHDFHYRDGVNRLELGYFAVKGGHSAADLIARVEQARIERSPLVIIGFHAVLPDTAPPVPSYWCSENTFRGFLDFLCRSELPVMTVSEAMARLSNW